LQNPAIFWISLSNLRRVSCHRRRPSLNVRWTPMTLLVPLTISCLIRLSHKATLLVVLTPCDPRSVLYCSSMTWRW